VRLVWLPIKAWRTSRAKHGTWEGDEYASDMCLCDIRWNVGDVGKGHLSDMGYTSVRGFTAAAQLNAPGRLT